MASSSKPGLEGFFDGLLGMKAEDFIGKQRIVDHATQRIEVLAGHDQQGPSLVKLSHARPGLPVWRGQ
jgi:hypothetical protein